MSSNASKGPVGNIKVERQSNGQRGGDIGKLGGQIPVQKELMHHLDFNPLDFVEREFRASGVLEFGSR